MDAGNPGGLLCPISVPRTQDGTAVFSFSEFCSESPDLVDYITLISTFHTSSPTPPPTHPFKTAVERSVSLFDAVYESGIRLCLHLPH